MTLRNFLQIVFATFLAIMIFKTLRYQFIDYILNVPVEKLFQHKKYFDFP